MRNRYASPTIALAITSIILIAGLVGGAQLVESYRSTLSVRRWELPISECGPLVNGLLVGEHVVMFRCAQGVLVTVPIFLVPSWLELPPFSQGGRPGIDL